MKLTNNSGKIISVGETVIIPGESATVVGYDSNEALKNLIDRGDLAIVKTARGK